MYVCVGQKHSSHGNRSHCKQTATDDNACASIDEQFPFHIVLNKYPLNSFFVVSLPKLLQRIWYIIVESKHLIILLIINP